VDDSNIRAARDLANDYWEGLLPLQPIFATFIGDERYDDRMPDPTEEGRAEEERLHQGALERLKAVDRSGLDDELRITMDLLEVCATQALKDLRSRVDQLDAVSHSMTGPGNLLADLASTQRADTPERIERYVARLHAIPAWLDGMREVAREGLDAGRTQPRVVADRAVGQVERLLAISPESSPSMGPVQGAGDDVKERVATALREGILPAYQRYLDMLKEYASRTRDDIGLSAVPGGEEFYAERVEAYTTLPLTAQEVHDTGQEQFASIMEERRAIASRLGFATAEEAIAAHDATGANRAKTREEFLEHTRDQVRRSWEAAPRFFGRLPRANCDVVAIEEFREDDMPGAFYQEPSMDGSRAGMYFVNTGGVEHRPLHQLATMTFHEANPGHHFQLSIETEFTDRLPLRRFNPGSGGAAFIEGWGLYSERLGDEMGLFLDDHERIGMLEQQAFRAGRLIVDSGMHALGWDRERAIQQMMATGTPRLECEIEVDRYISWPGQACAYMIGELQIQRWRRESSAERGASFDLKAFHDRLLFLGSLPLRLLDHEIRRHEEQSES
jgi:uncharacterized protein (DUF885 family)